MVRICAGDVRVRSKEADPRWVRLSCPEMNSVSLRVACWMAWREVQRLKIVVDRSQPQVHLGR